VAGEGVVGIERDVPLGQRRDHHLQRLPVLPLQVQMLGFQERAAEYGTCAIFRLALNRSLRSGKTPSSHTILTSYNASGPP
jgi:hypothetical protein